MTIHDVIEFVGVNKFHYLMLLFAIILHCRSTMGIVVVNYVMATRNSDLHLDSSQEGILGGMVFFGMVAGGLFWGVAMDVGGRKLTLSVSIICETFVSIVSTAAANYQFLDFARFFTGFFIHGSSASVVTIAGEFFPPNFRNRGFVMFGIAPGFAIAATAGIAWMVDAHNWEILFSWGFKIHSWRCLILISSIPSVVLTIAALFVPETPMFLVRQRKAEEALALMQKIWAKGSKQPPNEFPIKAIVLPPDEEQRNFWTEARYQVRTLFIRKNLRNTLTLCFVSFSVISSYNGINMWVPEIVGRAEDYTNSNPTDSRFTTCELVTLPNKSGATKLEFHDEYPDVFSTTAYVIAIVIGTCIIFTALIGCFVINLFGNKLTLIALSIVNAFLCLCMAFVPGGIIGFLVLLGFMTPFSVLCMSAFSAITIELFETEVRGVAVNFVMMCGRFGPMSSNLIFGFLIDYYCNLCFAYVAILLCASAILASFLPASQENRPRLYMYLDSAFPKLRQRQPRAEKDLS